MFIALSKFHHVYQSVKIDIRGIIINLIKPTNKPQPKNKCFSMSKLDKKNDIKKQRKEYVILTLNVSQGNLDRVKKYAHAITHVAMPNEDPEVFKIACGNGDFEILKELVKYKKIEKPLELFRRVALNSMVNYSFSSDSDQVIESERKKIMNYLMSVMSFDEKTKAMEFGLYLNSKEMVDLVFDKQDFKELFDRINKNGFNYNNENEAGVYFMQKYKSMNDKKIIKTNISPKSSIIKKKII